MNSINKQTFTKGIFTKSFSTLLTLIILFSISQNMTAQKMWQKAVEGNGDIKKKVHQVKGLDAIKIGSQFDVVLVQGKSEGLEIEADSNLHEYIEVEQNGGTLSINCEQNIKNPKAFKIYLTIVDLDKMDFSGAIDVESEGTMSFDNLEIETSGATDIELELRVSNNLNLDLSGASDLNLKGSAKSLDLEGSGAIDLDAYDLDTEEVTAEVSGAAEVEISVSQSIEVEVSGAGNFYYKGNPENISSEVSGAGTFKKKG